MALNPIPGPAHDAQLSPRLFLEQHTPRKTKPTMGSSDTPVTYNTSSQPIAGTPPSGGVFLKLVRSLSRSKSRSTPPPPLVSPSAGLGKTDPKVLERKLSRRESRSTPNGSSPGSSGRWLGQVGEAPGEFLIRSVAGEAGSVE